MKFLVVILSFLLFLFGLADFSVNYCYVKSNATALALTFSTKTAYQKVKGNQDEYYYLPSK